MSEKFEIWGVKDPNISSQLALAMKMNLFKEKAGLEVSCQFIESGTTMPNDVLKAEQKPFAFTQTPITSLLLLEKGMQTKILAPLADIAGTQQVVIHEASGISAPKDLEGKRIGMAKGAAVYIAITNMAKDHQVDLDKVYFINILPTEQLTGFRDGRLDAIACWEPWTSKAQTVGGKFYFSGTRSEIPGSEGDVSWLVNQSCLIAPDETIENNSDVIVAVLKVLKEATDIINYDFEATVKVLAPFFNLSQESLTNIMRKNSYSMTMDTLFRIGVLSFRNFLFETGRVSSSFAEDQLYTTAFLQQVDPSLVLLGEKPTPRVNIIQKHGIYFPEDVVLHVGKTPLQFLLADDSKVVRNFVNQVAEILGAKVVAEATNGRDAIEMFKQFRPNVVTMDLSMPGVSGVDAIKGILKVDPDVNIIVISGVDVKEVQEEVFGLGVKMFIKKPFVPERAAEVIRSVLA